MNEVMIAVHILDGLALLVAEDPQRANSTTDTDTHRLSYGRHHVLDVWTQQGAFPNRQNKPI